MTATVRLVTDFSPSLCSTGEPLVRAARYVRTRNMSRWHRPRSGRKYPDGRRSVSLWCGQTVTDLDAALRCGSADRLDAEVCGTCEGRALGTGQDDAPAGLPPLVFSPTKCRPPSRCPGSRSDALAEVLPGSRVARCLVCSDVLPMRAGGSPYSSTWGLTNHAPGAGLIPPCGIHGWHALVAVAGRAVCQCSVTGGAA